MITSGNLKIFFFDDTKKLLYSKYTSQILGIKPNASWK